jgi:menaquinone-dependent protoporphyrinogen IX oxidase
MRKFALIYGTTTGSTAEIAAEMKRALRERRVDVDLVAASDTTIDLDAYEVVIIGSGIYGGKAHEDVSTFLHRNSNRLIKKKTAVFAVCGTMCSRDGRMRKRADAFADVVAGGLSPTSKSTFATRLPDKGWFDNLMLRVLWKTAPGDHRDWEKIRSWALSLDLP